MLMSLCVALFSGLMAISGKKTEVSELEIEKLKNLYTFEFVAELGELFYDEGEDSFKEMKDIFVINGNIVKMKDGQFVIEKGEKNSE